MQSREYKDRVIRLFRDGEPNEQQWEEMATAVMSLSEGSVKEWNVDSIDNVIIGPLWQCGCCCSSRGEDCWNCGLPRPTLDV